MSMDLGAFVDFLADCSFKMPKFFPWFNSLLFQMVEFILEPPSSSIHYIFFSVFLWKTIRSLDCHAHLRAMLTVYCLCTLNVLNHVYQNSRGLQWRKVFSSRESLIDLPMLFSMMPIGILSSTPKSFTFYLFWFQFNAVINMPHTTVFPFISCVNLQTVTTRKIIIVSGKAKESYLHNNCLIGWLIKQSSATSGFLNVQ